MNSRLCLGPVPRLDLEDLSGRARQGRLPARPDEGLPEGRARPFPRARTRSSSDPKDPHPAEVHSRLVLPEEVPQDEGGRHRHPEELQGLQRKEKVSTNEDRFVGCLICIVFS